MMAYNPQTLLQHSGTLATLYSRASMHLLLHACCTELNRQVKKIPVRDVNIDLITCMRYMLQPVWSVQQSSNFKCIAMSTRSLIQHIWRPMSYHAYIAQSERSSMLNSMYSIGTAHMGAALQDHCHIGRPCLSSAKLCGVQSDLRWALGALIIRAVIWKTRSS